ncbi:zinc finger protein 106 [Cololabis saira]|uniref:zinc finger protein 106 n=1 Tax=Cololabis saira TaxID=129043 RepID=UPI002AD4CB22|nr:zinc finger protein 106 [Cololabis saira]
MARDRKCILCETVHVSKQEMDEHLRSMLHHRELEKLKGRDCGHECRVCKVKVVSLTDYAGHISSPTHKQNVEAAGKKDAGYKEDEDYFDQALVDLIQKRKEQIRKEKEAAAKLAAEEENRRKKEEYQKKLKELKERFRQECMWRPPPHGYSSSNQRYSCHRGPQFNGGSGEARPWQQDRQCKSATWHAQDPPNLQRWGTGEFFGGRMDPQVGRGSKTWGHGAYPGHQQSRLPWLSNGGSAHGLYGQNNISQYQQQPRPQSFLGAPFPPPPPPRLFTQDFNRFPGTGRDVGVPQDTGFQNGEVRSPDPDHNNSKSAKTFGSNPKLDKSCRWSPYPVASLPHGDTNPNTVEKHTIPQVQKPDKAPEAGAFSRPAQGEQRPGPLLSSRQCEEEHEKNHMKPKPKPKPKPKDKRGSRKANSSQRDGHQKSESAPTSQRTSDPSVDPGLGGAQQSKASTLSQSKTTGKATNAKQPGVKAAAVGLPLQPRQEKQLPDLLKTARHSAFEKQASLYSSVNSRVEVTHQITEELPAEQGPDLIGGSQNRPVLPEVFKPDRTAPASSDGSQSLQSLQVSTSTTEGSEPPAAAAHNEAHGKKAEKESCSDVPDEAMQVTEAGQSSESDASRGGDASALSKLKLPPVLKRDLTKHISPKSKTGTHEPNLNIARRVRNLSGSRRSDSEKDSGIKPTVRQLISSSGSHRNVNWDQVYQEVKKKQDKGKGLPRFGIEMVSHEQEYQSQEDEDVALLEAFPWDSMDSSSQGTSRKRSLSESSLAPAPTHSLLSSVKVEEPAQGRALSPEQQQPTVSHSCTPAQKGPEDPSQSDAETRRQPEKLTSATVRVLQRSDSALGDSSSGAEQHDGQGTGKRRRAAGDAPSTEASSVEHNSKRRKVKSKRERLQIDQLLAVSLREEELSRSLQTVDTSLIKARAALEAAYLEVQRLMMAKQQTTAEMSTLRNKRIELLKGMQGTTEETPQLELKEEKVDSFGAEPQVSSPARRSPGISTEVPSPGPGPAAGCASPPRPSPTATPVVIKEEPQSPVYVSSEQEPGHGGNHCAHSTTPQLQESAAATAQGPALKYEASPEKTHEPDQTNSQEPSDWKEQLSALVETTERGIQASNHCDISMLDSKASIKLSPSRRDSGALGFMDGADIQSAQSHLVFNMPASPSELRSGKRVRKLKKRKELKKAQGAEQPESTDTEMDEEAMRPRWLRPRRRPSGGSQVSTSSVPAEDREGDGNNKASKKPCQAARPDGEEQKPPGDTMELPQFAPVLDSEENMDTTPAGAVDAQVPDPCPGPQKLACNEVSSTSEMDLCRSSESDLPPLTFPKTSSDVSSDHGGDEIPSEGFFDGHQEAVNAMQIHNGRLYTCSGDRTVRAFDLESRECVAVFEGHSSKVSCLLVSAVPCLHHRLYSGSSDQTVRCYSLKTQELEQQFLLSDRVLCLHSRWKMLYAGLANGTVVTFNLRTNKQADVFECHGPRAVSCLASSQEGGQRILLVGSYDNTISVRGARNGLLLRTLKGHTKSVLCMKVVNDLVFSGSSDHSVYAHNIHTGELVHVYKGHSHAVTVVAVLGKVMVTACLDKLVRVYDLQSQEQLQVYGGHKDMVLCMDIHKNTIYTGCYDGSVQAIKLNLTQNHRCWWHGCSLVFGLREHLQQHLLSDHTSPNFQTLKCRWKKCEEFFCTRNSSKQVMLLHMQRHAEEDAEVEH